MGGAFSGFLESIAIPVDADELGAVNESVDEGDDAGSGGEDLGPLGEGLVGGEEDGSLQIASSHDLEQEVGVAVVVVEVADLIDDE